MNKGRKKKIEKVAKKYLSLKAKLGITTMLGILLVAIMTLVIASVTFISLVGIISTSIWRDRADEITEHPTGCTCGCVWIATNGESVNIETIIGENGEALNPIGQVNVIEQSMSNVSDLTTTSGADKTAGITASITSNLLGLTSGEWIYISDYGVYQIQDIIESDKPSIVIYSGASSSISSGDGSSDGDGSGSSDGEQEGSGESQTDGSESQESLSGNISLKNVYYIKSGKVTKGNQAEVKKPEISSSKISVPSYGHTTGSLTDTSIATKINRSELSSDNQKLLDMLLPGAVVASQYYNIHINLALALAPHEGGWDPIRDGGSNGFHIYSLQGKGPFTGTYSKGSTRWSSHYDAEETVIHFAHNYHRTNNVSSVLPGEGYAQIIKSYSDGYVEQIRRHSLSGFNNYYENDGVDTVEEYKVAAEAYAKKIIDTAKKFEAINNIDIALQYIKDNGLEDKYINALSWMQKYESERGKYANATPNGVEASKILGELPNMQTGSLSGPTAGVEGSAGYWTCTCPRPCPDCRCHDIEVGQDGNSADALNRDVFPPNTPGQSSGLWGTYEELSANIEALNNGNKPLYVGNVEQLKSNLRKLLQFVGMAPNSKVTYKVDKFAGPDGTGFVHYGQGRNSPSKEPYKTYRYNDSKYGGTFAESACGLYSLAMAISTMEKTWCNPAEIAIALNTYTVRTGKQIATTQMGGSESALYTENVVDFLVEAGFKAEKGSLSKDKLDKCLESNGIFMFCLSDPKGVASVKTTGHFVVIRQRTENGNYLMGDSCRINDNEITFSTLSSIFKHSAIYIMPRENSNVVHGNKETQGITNVTSGNITGKEQNIVAEAKKHLGKAYQSGAEGPDKFDCSGFVYYVYNQCGIYIRRMSADSYYSMATHITKEQARPGDLVFYHRNGKSSKVGHVAIWLGDGQIIHAPEPGSVIKIIQHKYMVQDYGGTMSNEGYTCTFGRLG